MPVNVSPLAVSKLLWIMGCGYSVSAAQVMVGGSYTVTIARGNFRRTFRRSHFHQAVAAAYAMVAERDPVTDGPFDMQIGGQ